LNKKGFTLLEVVFSLALFGLTISALSPAFLSYLEYISDSELRTEAVAAAQQVLDDLRFEEPPDMPLSGSDDAVDITIGDHTFEVVVTYCAEASFCVSNNTRHLSVDVTYFDREMYHVETVYTQLR